MTSITTFIEFSVNTPSYNAALPAQTTVFRRVETVVDGVERPNFWQREVVRFITDPLVGAVLDLTGDVTAYAEGLNNAEFFYRTSHEFPNLTPAVVGWVNDVTDQEIAYLLSLPQEED